MPQKEDVEDTGDDDAQCGDDPDDKGEQHSEVDNSFLLVAGLDHSLDVHEKLLKSGAIFGGVLANRQELSLHDGVQSHGVDRNTRPLSNNDDESALELEVHEEGNVVGTLLTLRQLSKDEETAPSSSAAGKPHTLPDSGHGLKITFSHAT